MSLKSLAAIELAKFAKMMSDSTEYCFENPEDALNFFKPEDMEESSTPGVYHFMTETLDGADRDLGVPKGMEIMHAEDSWSDGGGGSGNYIAIRGRLGVEIDVWAPEYCDDECDARASFVIYVSESEEALRNHMEALAMEARVKVMEEAAKELAKAMENIPKERAQEILSKFIGEKLNLRVFLEEKEAPEVKSGGKAKWMKVN